MRRIGALAGVLAAVLWTSPVTAAEPAPGGGGGIVAPVLALPDMGVSGTIAFTVNRFNASKSVSFPVLPGLVPEEMRARIELPVFLRFGTLTVSQNGRQISRVGLPLDSDGDLVIPLGGVQLSGEWLTLDLALTVMPAWDYCWDDYAPVRLTNAAVVFSGAEVSPKTVADFLPSVLRKVTIGLPAKPSPAESSAAVQVATAVAQRNGQKPDVVVVPLPAGGTAFGAPSAPLERRIVVKEGADKGLSLQGGGFPSLLVSGEGAELVDQARLLSDESLKLAVSTTAVPGPLPEPEFVSDSTTLADLNQTELLDESLWPKVNIEVDQTRFGHPLADIRIHLVGSYTPLPENFGGEATVTVGGEVLDRWAATGDGIIDRSVTIPARLIRRSVNLEVAVRATGNPGRCGDHLPIALRIDPASTVQVGTANPPIPRGFQSFPQALMPRVDFGIGEDAFADTVRAARLAVGLQRLSAVPLTTEVKSVREAIDGGGSAVLIASGGWTDQSFTLPFNTDGGKITVQGLDPDGEPLSMTLEPQTRFGSIQTIFDGQRAVMIATSNGAPSQLDALLSWLDGSGRWSGLNGRAIISIPDGAPLTVPSPLVTDSAQDDSATQGSQQDWFWWVAGGVAAIAGVGALLILFKAGRASARSRES
jgi:hypothetical protein